ncbi:MAG: hypothetical protein K6T39_13885, partial [Anoxybacillus ayderensis]|nr:hypothetical protein [Anoxybacillus ayderensis]
KMVQAPTPEVNSLASTIKTLAVYGVFSLNGDRQATLLDHRLFIMKFFIYYKQMCHQVQGNHVSIRLFFL